MERDFGVLEYRAYCGADLLAALAITALEKLTDMVLGARLASNAVGIVGSALRTHRTIWPAHNRLESIRINLDRLILIQVAHGIDAFGQSSVEVNEQIVA